MRFQIKYQTLENTPIVLKLNFVEERGTEDMREGEIESYFIVPYLVNLEHYD